MFNQLLTEIKEDLKDLRHYTSNGYVFGIRKGRITSNGYVFGIRKERIKTKLQEWHRMASDEKEFLETDFLEWFKVKDRIKELSTFIQEIEKIAKEQGVNLK